MKKLSVASLISFGLISCPLMAFASQEAIIFGSQGMKVVGTLSLPDGGLRHLS